MLSSEIDYNLNINVILNTFVMTDDVYNTSPFKSVLMNYCSKSVMK